MALKKDKVKVIDEVLDESRLKAFLALRPPEGVNPDYNILERAYRGLTAEYFDSFLDLFTSAGLDINARSPAGKTILGTLSEHQQAGDYIAALEERGATL